ncbi:MAG: hypothetical protein C5B50_00250, partial [Verrucomicrobia bacterium]
MASKRRETIVMKTRRTQATTTRRLLKNWSRHLAIGLLLGLLGLLLCATPASAQSGTNVSAAPSATPVPPPGGPAKRSAADLEKLAIPIALHPDPLIALILPAAAYPLEVVKAARFVRDTNNIPKVDDQPWDDSIKALARFPEVIAKMDADLEWTVNLGQAFVEQPKELMDAIQELRRKAQQAGNLKTSEHQIVSVTNIVVLQTNVTQVTEVTKEIIQVAPANPSVIYVPSYPPAIYYPWYPYYPYAAPLVSFGVGFAWGAFWGAAWGSCNWGHGCVDVDIDSNRNVNRNTDRNRDRASTRDRASNTRDRASNNAGRGGGKQQWKPDQNRMRQSGGASASTREARGWGGSSGSRPSTGNMASRPSAGTRPSTGNPASRPSAGNSMARSGASSGSRPSTSQSSRSSAGSNRSSSGSSAFNRSGGGSSARASSSRGSFSRGSGGGGSRGG